MAKGVRVYVLAYFSVYGAASAVYSGEQSGHSLSATGRCTGSYDEGRVCRGLAWTEGLALGESDCISVGTYADCRCWEQ